MNTYSHVTRATMKNRELFQHPPPHIPWCFFAVLLLVSITDHFSAPIALPLPERHAYGILIAFELASLAKSSAYEIHPSRCSCPSIAKCYSIVWMGHSLVCSSIFQLKNICAVSSF